MTKRSSLKKTAILMGLIVAMALTAPAWAEGRNTTYMHPFLAGVIQTADLMMDADRTQLRANRLRKRMTDWSLASGSAAVSFATAASAPGNEGGMPPKDKAENGTDPRSLGFKFMPYTRYTEMNNGLKSSDDLALFAMVKIPPTPFTSSVWEWSVKKSVDFAQVFADLPSDPNGLLACGPPTCPTAIPLPAVAALGGFDVSGTGDLRARFIQGLANLNPDGVSTTLIAILDVIVPTASDPILGGERFMFGPAFAHVTGFSQRSFLAMLHFYFFDAGHLNEDIPRGDTSYYLGRYFFQWAWPKSGFYLLPEVQVMKDFENDDNGWSIFAMPELGKMFMAGKVAMTAYIKPGFAVDSPDPTERHNSVEFGMRMIPPAR